MTQDREEYIFCDPTLQARLMEAVQAAGFSYEVTENGSILYDCGNRIDPCINDVIGSVFDAYYCVEISDVAKAERYRRFTRMHGTKVIEYIHCGRNFFVQKLREERLFRYRGTPTHASLVLQWDDLVPEDVMENLRIAPTFSYRKGEVFQRPTLSSWRRKDAPLRCTPLSRQKLDLLKVLSLPCVFVFTSENEKPVGPVRNVGKSRCFLRDFPKSLWESALFADFHRDGIFHRPYASAFEIRTLILSVFALAA